MTPELSQRLRDQGLDPLAVASLVRTALAEDGETDVTSEPIFDPRQVSTADFTAREEGVVAGLVVAETVFEVLMDGEAELERHFRDGDHVAKGDVLLTVTAPTVKLLRAERIALNFMTHLSGIASQTALWVKEIEGTGARVRDSRSARVYTTRTRFGMARLLGFVAGEHAIAARCRKSGFPQSRSV